MRTRDSTAEFSGQEPVLVDEIQGYADWLLENPTTGWETDVTQAPMYIDNIAETVSLDMSRGYVVRCQGLSASIVIPFGHINYDSHDRIIAVDRVFPDRLHATLGVADAILASAGSGAQSFYAFYEGPFGVVVPTTYSPSSTPRILEGIRRKDQQMQEAAIEARNQMALLAVTLVGGRVIGAGLRRMNRWAQTPKELNWKTGPPGKPGAPGTPSPGGPAGTAGKARAGSGGYKPGSKAKGLAVAIAIGLKRGTPGRVGGGASDPVAVVSQRTGPEGFAKVRSASPTATPVALAQAPAAAQVTPPSPRVQTAPAPAVAASKGVAVSPAPSPMPPRILPNEPSSPYITPLTLTERQTAERLMGRSLGLSQPGPAEVVRWESGSPKSAASVVKTSPDGEPEVMDFQGRSETGELVTVRTVKDQGGGRVVRIEVEHPNFATRDRDKDLPRAMKAVGMGNWRDNEGHIVPFAEAGADQPFNFESQPGSWNKSKKGRVNRRTLERLLEKFVKSNEGDIGKIEVTRKLNSLNRLLSERFVVRNLKGEVTFDKEVTTRGQLIHYDEVVE